MKRKSFILSSHIHLSSHERAEDISLHFAAISQELAPLSPENFSPDLSSFISSPQEEIIPTLSEYDVFLKINSAKKPKSSVKGDFHRILIKAFNVEYAQPASIIFNSILKNKEYPKQWKIEYGVPIPKTSPPESLDDLRVISKTPFFSKVFESFLVDCSVVV